MSDMILMKVDQARALLASARDAPDAKRIADMARAAEVYARRQKLSDEIIQHAHAIKVDALTLMGEFLKDPESKNQGTKGQLVSRGVIGASREEAPITRRPTLAESRISFKESSTAQALATLKEDKPDLHEKVKAGTMTIPQARREVARSEKRADLEVKAKAAPPSADWRLVEGDCIAILDTIEAGSVRLVFADPPYNIGIDYGEGASADCYPGEIYLEWCRLWIEKAARTLAPDGSMWVLICDEWADEFGCMLRKAGLHRRAWIKWYESFGINCYSNFNRTSRHLFYMVRDPKRFVFNPEAVTRPSDRQVKYGDKRADPGGKTWDDVWGINPPIPRLVGNHAERLPDFPTQLPLALLRAVVGCASEPGDLILDPFNGSGATGEAAIELGRRYVGIEKSAEFAGISRRRLAAATHHERIA